MDMSLRDTVWTDHGQGMHNAARCTRPAHSLTTLAHSSRRLARSHGLPRLYVNTLENQTPVRDRQHRLLGANPTDVEQTAGAI